MKSERAWLLTGATTLFLVGTDVFIMSPLLPSIADEFVLTPAQAGWLVTIMSIMYACGSPFMGSLFDQLHTKRSFILWGGLIGFCLANIWTGLSTSFLMLLCSRAVAGLSLAAIAPCVYAYVSDLAPSGKRAAWLSFIVSGNLTGLWIGTPLGTLLADYGGWRSPFWLIAACSFVLAWINLAIWPQTKRSHSPANTAGPAPVVSMLRSVLVTVYWAVAIYAVYTYLGTTFIQETGLSSSQLASTLIAYGLGAMFGSLFGGKLADRWGSKAISSTSLFGLFLMLVAVGLFYREMPWLYFLLFSWSIVGYAFVPAYQSRLASEYPSHLGLIMAWNITGMYVGMTMGSYLGGMLYELGGFASIVSLSAVIALLAGFSSLRAAPIKKEAARPEPDHFRL
ncbi:MFS transporter [Brevibacillus panacihumi W25]|uniref:MFS transporter n=1 Tax=Brevibacillus panacihumi W25 TaxID=1408254 RepID=V6M867_9BACL|nr:MFS transporter [Brevibacillus panacihumi]EST54472.1 MFS transporter [Brevibacillus panacihumi W25]